MALSQENIEALKYSKSLFLKACAEEDLEYVKKSLFEGFNPNFYSDHGFLEPLYLACGYYHNIDLAIELLNYGANIEGREWFVSPLQNAIEYRNYDIIEELVKRGANVDSINNIDRYELLEDEKELVLNLLGKNRNIKPVKR
jgi:ankyrin repeat protein